MQTERFSCLNGALLPSQHCPSSGDDAFRLCYGLYETYLFRNGEAEHADLHLVRLLKGLQVLGFADSSQFTLPKLTEMFKQVAAANDLNALSRLRFQVFTDSAAAPFTPSWLIEAFPLAPEMTAWLPAGIHVAILPNFKKQVDASSNCKISHNKHFLPARKFIADHHLDDALLLNEFGNVCESAIANLFLFYEGKLVTPPLSEGCLAGTMRKVIIDRAADAGFAVCEQPVAADMLYQADEIFLSNGIRKMRAVRTFQDKTYAMDRSKQLYDRLFSAENI